MNKNQSSIVEYTGYSLRLKPEAVKAAMKKLQKMIDDRERLIKKKHTFVRAVSSSS